MDGSLLSLLHFVSATQILLSTCCTQQVLRLWMKWKITFLILLPLHIEHPSTSKILETLQTFEYCSHTRQCETQLCSQQGSPPSIGTGWLQWNSSGRTLHLHGQVSWDLFSCGCSTSLGGNSCSSSKWHAIYLKREQMVDANTSQGYPLLRALQHWFHYP